MKRAKLHVLQPTFTCLWARRPNALGTPIGMSGMIKNTTTGTMTVVIHTRYMPLMQNDIHMILMYGSTIRLNLSDAMGNISPHLP